MKLNDINLLEDKISPFEKIGKEWMLVTSGDLSSYNTMTASWGFMGVMWNKNVVTIVIRPQRYTLEFLKKNDTFTLSFFDESKKDILKYCGSHSGRDVNKTEKTGLVPFEIGNSVSFTDAKTAYVCRKLYMQSLDENSFIDKSLLSNYKDSDYHIAITAEIERAVTIE